MIFLMRAKAIAEIQDLHNFSLFIEDCFRELMDIYAPDFWEFTQDTCDYLCEIHYEN